MLHDDTQNTAESEPASLVEVKDLLRDAVENADEIPTSGTADVIPILHNHGLIILQFNGWSINLKADGTWIWEDTTGG